MSNTLIKQQELVNPAQFSPTQSKKFATDDSAGGSKVQVESEEIVSRAGKTFTRRRKIWVNPQTAERIKQRRRSTDWARSLSNYLPLYFVGSVIRDKYLNRVSEVIELVATVGLPHVQEVFDNLNIGYKLSPSNNELLLQMDDIMISVTSKEPTQLVHDLANSDFTINAIAQSISGKFYDPFNGLQDIKSRVLRSPYSNSKRAFSLEPERILRAGMYLGEFNFKPHQSVIYGIAANREKLEETDKRKIGLELKKIMTSRRPWFALNFLQNQDCIKYIAPELEAMVKLPQKQPKHKHDVWKHTLTVLKKARSEDFILNMGILFHDIGKTITASPDYKKFPEHEEKGAKLTQNILSRLGFPSEDIERITNLVLYHTFLCERGDKASTGEYRKVRIAIEQDIDRLIDMAYADRHSCLDNDISPIKRSEKKFRKLDVPKPKNNLSPLDSVDIMETLSIGDSPIVAEIQNHLHQKVVDGELEYENEYEAKKIAMDYLNNVKKSFDGVLNILHQATLASGGVK